MAVPRYQGISGIGKLRYIRTRSPRLDVKQVAGKRASPSVDLVENFEWR
jgi:hypothetical protein